MVRRRDRLQQPPKVEEPVTKRPKVDNAVEDSLAVIHDNLLGNCLCAIPDETLHLNTVQWDLQRVLKFLSCVHMLCEVSLRQSSDGLMCSRINDLTAHLLRNDDRLLDQILHWLSDPNQFVGYAAGRALSGLLLCGKSNVELRWLNSVVECAVATAVPRHMSLSLDVFRRVVEWRDGYGRQPGEDRGRRGRVGGSCRPISVVEGLEAGCDSSNEVKCICIKVLGSKWPALVAKVDGMLSVYSSDYECAVITFISLWESIISVKANLSVIDTKPFYLNLSSFIALLNSSVPNLVWIQLLNLFNEVLCYATTLALQDCLAEEPCALAHHVMRCVKDWHLLDLLPQSGRDGGSSSRDEQHSTFTSSTEDKVLLQKMALLVLKSVAVTVKETRYDSSSDSSCSDASSSSSSSSSSHEEDMVVIERSIREVLRQLDLCVKSRLPFHPLMSMSEWVVQLFADQDDHLIESMICLLDVATGLYYRPNHPSAVANPLLSPTHTLLAFLQVVSHDPELLLDLLVSNETCFLLYLLRVLKFLRRHWEEFVRDCGRALEQTMTVFIRLRISIKRLVDRALFPYNIGPVLRLLEKCEELYEGAHA